MEYPLKQYGCDKCGKLSEVLDPDQPLPKGWTYVGDLMETLYCPKCSRNKKINYDNRKDTDRD